MMTYILAAGLIAAGIAAVGLGVACALLKQAVNQRLAERDNAVCQLHTAVQERDAWRRAAAQELPRRRNVDQVIAALELQFQDGAP
jgi:hypothetical protein